MQTEAEDGESVEVDNPLCDFPSAEAVREVNLSTVRKRVRNWKALRELHDSLLREIESAERWGRPVEELAARLPASESAMAAAVVEAMEAAAAYARGLCSRAVGRMRLDLEMMLEKCSGQSRHGGMLEERIRKIRDEFDSALQEYAGGGIVPHNLPPALAVNMKKLRGLSVELAVHPAERADASKIVLRPHRRGRWKYLRRW